ncbi:Kae1-like domain-containing protein [Herbaspirillum autotrophicum]|uniref:Kae1-like domain-containing protein n=1 Tax=Herbaspirillum autotrophicum TaxID=180195 RepID=UPI00067DA5BF|nr:hypothetical protein [Herbaspirillum autotrophicum]
MTSQQLPAAAGDAPATSLVRPTVLACGAWLKNRACLLRGDQVIWSQVHGDLGEADNCLALEASVNQLITRYGPEISAIAHDLHPDFFSTRLAQTVAAQLDVPAIAVQHHHAHIGAVMAEFGVAGPVVGLALDGVGLGLDGAAWGGELLWLDGADWQRLGHLQPLALAGGDTAAREPWRMAAAVLHALGRQAEIAPRFAASAGAAAAQTVQVMLERNLNCPSTTGAGRWFDAAAGVLGISVRQSVEAEAAIALERLAQTWLHQHAAPPARNAFDIGADGTLDLRPLLTLLLALADRSRDGDPHAVAQGAALFHLELVDALTQWTAAAAIRNDTRTVALGGGCFFNQIVSSRLIAQLQQRGLRVLLPRSVSCGDAGLALGQAWVAREQLMALHYNESEVTSCV